MKYIIYSIILVFLFGCANVTPLSGGDKDTTAPTLINVSPPNQSVQFTQNEIVMTFDETIIINTSEKVVISPFLENDVKVKSNKNKLILSFNNQLEKNTTYCLNLNQLIKDVNEGNLINNLSYSFSTGRKLDTLYIRGKVIDAITLLPVENAYVGLYYFDKKEDSLLFKHRPTFLTKSLKNGEFTITNLPKKPFSLFAIEDLDNNYRFSLPQERVGFFSDSLMPNKDDIEIFLFDQTHSPDSAQPMKSDSSLIEFGLLKVDSLPDTSLVAQLVKNDKVMYESSMTDPLIMDSVKVGRYSLRIIYDENDNGRWDSGHLISKTLPEKIMYHSSEIEIRNNWEIYLTWNTKE